MFNILQKIRNKRRNRYINRNESNTSIITIAINQVKRTKNAEGTNNPKSLGQLETSRYSKHAEVPMGLRKSLVVGK